MFVEEKKQGEVKELDDASKLLLEAAALLERKGEWGQGGLRRERAIGLNCILSAIWTLREYANIERGIAEQRLVALFGSKQAVYDWNDAPDRTATEVIAKLRAVAFSSWVSV